MTCARCEGENDDYSGTFVYLLNSKDFDRRFPSSRLNTQFEIPEYEFCCPHCGSFDYTKQIGETDADWKRDTDDDG